MTNREKYRFCDFTLANYSQLLDQALAQDFVFSDYEVSAGDNQKELVWRHDVEFSVQRACKMASLEQEKGVQAHYFVQLHSEFYNTLESGIIRLLTRIKSLGHYIGLHFDAHFWQVETLADLEHGLTRDKDILEDVLGVKIKSFSFHNTTPALLAWGDLHYAELLNVYAREIRRKYRYCTDSTGIWRYERLNEVLNDSTIRHLQVLTHDAMWSDSIMAPRQRVLRCIQGRAQRTLDWYDECLASYGQLNVDEDEEDQKEGEE